MTKALRSSTPRTRHLECYDLSMAISLKRCVLGGLMLIAAVVAALPLALETERRDLDNEARSRAPGSFVELTKGQVHYELAGSGQGPLVVFVHGFSVPSFIWDPTFEELLARGFRVLRYDLYGRGYSDRPDVAYDRTLYVEQLYELLVELRLEDPVDLVGLSMGGPVVASFTSSYPERVNRLVFVDPFVGPADAGVVAFPGLGEYVAVVYFGRILPTRLAEDFYHPEKVPPWEGRFREQMRYRGLRRALLRSLRQFMAEDFSDLYAEVGRAEKPTLLVWGRHDRTVPFSHSERVAGLLGAKLLVVEESGHTPHLERPEIFEPELVKFLRENQAEASGETSVTF
jgi:pimeloyl-ACP methyl ester carboxylesterase